MVRLPRGLSAVVLLAMAVSLGCSSGVSTPWVARRKLDASQAQNRSLNEQSKAQLAEIENLKIHARNVEDQLIRAEENLAQLDEQQSRSKLSANGLPAGLKGRLADLARRNPSLQYDAKTGVCKLDADVVFDSGETQLKPAAERMLVEFAELFQAPDAQALKIMVVGHTDARAIKGREIRTKYPNNWHLSAGRALAVADKLRSAGLPESRMGVAGFGPHQPAVNSQTADARKKNRRVEIFVLGPETPIVGWNDGGGGIYR